MQKSKKKKWLFVFLILLFGITKVNAECDNAKLVELSRQANNIRTNYELTEVMYEVSTGERMDPEDSEYTREELEEMEQDAPYGYEKVVSLNIQNITKDIYVILRNVSTKEEIRISYGDTNEGTYSLLVEDVSKPIKFSVDVYSEDPCTIDLLRSTEIITPMHNNNYYLPLCRNSDAYYCQEWSTVEIDVSQEEAMQRELKKQYASQKQEEKEEESFWKKNEKIIRVLAIILVIALIGWGGFTVIKRKRSRAI